MKKRKAYPVDKRIKAFLETERGREAFEEHAANYRPRHKGWERTILLYLIDGETAPNVQFVKPVNPRVKLKPIEQRIYAAQKGRCYICRRPIKQPNRDHVTPRSRGGIDERNILLTHFECNAAKKDNLPTARQLAYLAKINRIVYGTEMAIINNVDDFKAVPRQQSGAIFSTMNEALDAAMTYESRSGEFYGYATQYVFDTERQVVGVRVMLKDENDFTVGWLAVAK